MLNFTVCMSVYKGDNAEYFFKAISSIINQSAPPSEIILVIDGPISIGLNDIITDFTNQLIYLKVYRFEKNQGHAIARQKGLDLASNNWIAIMDSDDVAEPDRFEKQIKYIEKNAGIDVIGGQIDEFLNIPSNIIGSRIVPTNHDEIIIYLKSRCPMNLVTVMFKKEYVLKVGGFIDWYCEEDYYLWIRMALAGCKFANLPDTLVNVRVGKDMYARRGGWRYFKSEARLQGYMLSHKVISYPRYIFNTSIRFLVQVLLPNNIRGFLFKILFRK